MDAIDNPFYLDWTFWTVIISAIAVFLSQIPPIHILVKKAKIDFEMYSKISLTHKIGNPNLQTHLLITNTGGRRVRIKGIECTIKRDDVIVATLPTQNYLQKPNDTSSVLFTSFSLNPNEDWSHIINLFNTFKREDEKRYLEIEAQMKADFLKKLKDEKKNTGEDEERKEVIELSQDLVEPAHVFFNKNFVWLPGQYELIVKIKTNYDSADISKIFKFVVFETHTEQLKEITKEYKYGGGFWWNPENTKTEAIIEITEA